ncbi:MAG: RNA-binding cell elongation regulator Jag/EloR, partial [Armatimonadota bacterium]
EVAPEMEAPKVEAAPEVRAAPAPRVKEPVSPEVAKEAGEYGREVLQRMLDNIGAGGIVRAKTSDSQVSLEIEGGDSSVLIGKNGQTINALQYLIGVITNKRFDGQVRVMVDAEGFRNRREEALKSQAFALAAQVKEAGQEAVLEPLPPAERRIIHAALADNPDIYTYSEGEEPERYVVISPRK